MFNVDKAYFPSPTSSSSLSSDSSHSSPKRKWEAAEEKSSKRQKTTLHFDRLSSSELTDAVFLASIASVAHLKEIAWVHGFNKVTDKSIEALKDKAKDLISLELQSAGEITAQPLSELIAESDQLRSLDFSSCQEVNDLFIKALAHCPYLEKLSLRYCVNLTDVAIKSLGESCPNLKILDLTGCESCTDENILSVISSTKKLVKLNLSSCEQLTDDVLPAIATLDKLEILDLAVCTQITDKAFSSLERQHFPSLKEIDLSNTAVTHLTLQKFIEIGLGSSLLTLNLNYCQGIDWKALKTIPSFIHLKSLELASNTLNKFMGILEKLTKCTQLEILNINYLKGFENIGFNSTDVFPLIRSMPQLKILHVAGLGKAEDFKKIVNLNKNLQLIFRDRIFV